MKYFLVYFFGFICISLYAQETAGIEYSPDVDFNWSLFKGKVNPHHIDQMGEHTGAVTVSSLNYTTSITGSIAKIRISAIFLPSESWTKYPKLDHPDEALNHEKRHFDICEIYARKLRQAVLNMRVNRSQFNHALSNIFQKIANEEQAEQSKYDRETRHSMDAEQQLKWNQNIDSALHALSAYSNPIVKVELN